MIYIIATQKGRDPGVILFDYNNENLDETDYVLARDQCQDTADYIKRGGDVQRVGNNYRKNEVKLFNFYKQFFIFQFICFFIVQIYLLASNNLFASNSYVSYLNIL